VFTKTCSPEDTNNFYLEGKVFPIFNALCCELYGRVEGSSTYSYWWYWMEV